MSSLVSEWSSGHGAQASVSTDVIDEIKYFLAATIVKLEVDIYNCVLSFNSSVFLYVPTSRTNSARS